MHLHIQFLFIMAVSKDSQNLNILDMTSKFRTFNMF
jgi:hypothetical protein